MSGLLADKIVVITGGGSGIGAAGARLAARDGATVVVADLALEAAERVAADTNGTALSVDVRDSASVQAMVSPAEGTKCARCWTYTKTVGLDSHHPELCDRCVGAVGAGAHS